MCSNLKFIFLISFIGSFCVASYHEQYRVPKSCTDKWESYVFNDKEYVVQNLAVNWENAKILCLGHHNGTLAVLDTKEKSEFLAEALSESQLPIESVWVGAKRNSADDPAGYRWGQGLELRRTAADVFSEAGADDHYPVWLNRTRVPVPDGGADCVALERAHHDRPVFVDLHCQLERPFACEREAKRDVKVTELKVVRCRTGLYHVYDGRLNWHQAAAYCVLHKMSLANIGTMRCLKKLGMTMLKTRPSIENAWIGSRGTLGKWTWVDTGASIFQLPTYTDSQAGQWPPMRYIGREDYPQLPEPCPPELYSIRDLFLKVALPVRDRSSMKQSGCLQLDRHAAHAPVFMEARCERKMQFICYQGIQSFALLPATPSDDIYYYVLVRQLLYWQHAYENCQRLNGTLASVDSNDVLIQLLLVMGENKEEPVHHIWISGRLNMTKDVSDVTYSWYNPNNGKKIYDPLHFNDPTTMLYMPPWLDEEFSMDNPCLNLDRQDHLNGLVYGLPCDTPQYSICMIEKSLKPVLENTTEGYESS